VSGMNEANQKLLEGLSSDYFEILFPGVDPSNANSFEEQAKKMLAEEMRKVYKVTEITAHAEREAAMAKILGAGGVGSAVAAQAERDKEITQGSVRSKIQRR
jgi:hypothetical protein